MFKKIVVAFLVFTALICCLNPAFALDKTDTGFYYPIGTKNFNSEAGTWLARDPNYGGRYFGDKYHIGVDMMTKSTEANVYAIAPGELFYVHRSYDWGATIGSGNNCALFIRHITLDGKIFTGLYGHLRYDSIPENTIVTAGQVIGKTGDYPGGIHLHFGIRMGDSLTPSPWGMMPIKAWTENGPKTNGFIDPIAFIEHNALLSVGYFADGWHSDGTSEAFLKCYTDNAKTLGNTLDNGKGSYVHWWPDNDSKNGLLVQDFLTPEKRWAWIIYNPKSKEAFPVEGDIAISLFNNAGYKNFGAPTGKAQNFLVGYTSKGYAQMGSIQQFEKGYILWNLESAELHYGEDISQIPEISYRIAANADKPRTITISSSGGSSFTTTTNLQTNNPTTLIINGKEYSYTPLRWRYYKWTEQSGIVSVERMSDYQGNYIPPGHQEITGEEYLTILKNRVPLARENDRWKMGSNYQGIGAGESVYSYYARLGSSAIDISDPSDHILDHKGRYRMFEDWIAALKIENDPNMINIGSDMLPLYVPKGSPAYLNIVKQLCPDGWEIGFDGKLRKMVDGKSILEAKYGDTIVLPSGQIIHPDDPGYRDYYFTYYSSYATKEQLAQWEKEHPPETSSANANSSTSSNIPSSSSSTLSLAVMPPTTTTSVTTADQAVQNFLAAEFKNPPLNTEAPVPVEYVLQPGPGEGKDIWIINQYRMGRGFGFGGSDNYKLSVGGQTKAYIDLSLRNRTNSD